MKKKRSKKLPRTLKKTLIKSDDDFLELAYQEALKAELKDEVPVGAVIVRDGAVIARAHNLKESRQDVLAHAELLAIQKAQKKLKTWRLEACTVYVTLEPCLICASALQQSRVARVVYGASDKKAGAASLGFSIHNHATLNHQYEMFFLEVKKHGEILTEFFKRKRVQKKLK